MICVVPIKEIKRTVSLLPEVKAHRLDYCPCCGGTQWKLYYKNTSLNTIQSAQEFFYGGHTFIQDIYSCAACKYKFINQIPKNYVHFYQNNVLQETQKLKNHRVTYFKKIKKLIPELKDNSSILDIGCGNGSWLELWTKDHQCYGIEYSKNHQEMLSQKT